MRNAFYRFSGFAFLLLSLSPRPAAALPFSFFNFQLGAIGVYPATSTSSWFAQAAWTPTIGLGGLGLRGEVGFTAPSNGAGTRFLAMNFEALAQLTLIPKVLTIEGGGGFHDWEGGNGGTNGALSAGIVIPLVGIDRIYVTYTRVFLGAGVDELKAGIGFTL